MASMRFEDVEVWRKAHEFVLSVYRLTESFPKHETYGLTSQLRRAAVSIPANFAEGFGKMTIPDKLRFYSMSQGSLEECRYYLILGEDLRYAKTMELRKDLDVVAKLLGAYISGIRRNVRNTA